MHVGDELNPIHPYFGLHSPVYVPFATSKVIGQRAAHHGASYIHPTGAANSRSADIELGLDDKRGFYADKDVGGRYQGLRAGNAHEL